MKLKLEASEPKWVNSLRLRGLQLICITNHPKSMKTKLHYSLSRNTLFMKLI